MISEMAWDKDPAPRITLDPEMEKYGQTTTVAGYLTQLHAHEKQPALFPDTYGDYLKNRSVGEFWAARAPLHARIDEYGAIQYDDA
jgi:hypothetical protein